MRQNKENLIEIREEKEGEVEGKAYYEAKVKFRQLQRITFQENQFTKSQNLYLPKEFLLSFSVMGRRIRQLSGTSGVVLNTLYIQKIERVYSRSCHDKRVQYVEGKK